MENASSFYFTNQTFDILHMQDPIDVSEVVEAVINILMIWTFSLNSIYLLSHIIMYLNKKSPNLQTVLDGFYIQFFANGIGISIMSTILQLMIESNVVFHIENHILTQIVAWMFHSFYAFSSLSLTTCCVARALCIFWQAFGIEAMNDKKCWFYNG